MDNEIVISQEVMQKALADGFANFLYMAERTGSGEVGRQIPAAIASVVRERLTEELLASVVREAVDAFLESHSQEIIKSLGKSGPPKRPSEKAGRQAPEGPGGPADG